MSLPQENHQISIFSPYWRWNAIKLTYQFIPEGPISKYLKTNIIGNVFTKLQMNHFGLFLKSQACYWSWLPFAVVLDIFECLSKYMRQFWFKIFKIFLSSLHEAPAGSAIFNIFLFNIYIFTKSRDPVFFRTGWA